MKTVLANFSTGALCKINLLLAMLGGTATLTLEDGAKIFAALATGIWFTLQCILALLDRRKRRRSITDEALDVDQIKRLRRK